MKTFKGPDWKVVSADEVNKTSPFLFLKSVSKRSIGLCFRVDSMMYLYGYHDIEDELGIDDIPEKVDLLDLREYDEDIIYLQRDQFKLVEILESDENYYLSELLTNETVDVEHWIMKGIEKVLMEMFNHFYLRNTVLEECCNIFGDNSEIHPGPPQFVHPNFFENISAK
ncbi:MAG TPA: hypothetical protein DDX98_07520 [Bacteroidales bacterium]|jgi:hypothetical protein|nr:hypothetical protein [Bacteroidales bacterium]